MPQMQNAFGKQTVISAALAMMICFSTFNSEAAEGVQQKCNNNTSPPRKSIQCTFHRADPGMVWNGGASRARKLFVSKPAGDTGQDVVRLWIDGKPSGEFVIYPGDKRQIFRKKGNSTIVARAEVETLHSPKSGRHEIYVHFETLDRPVIPECQNTANADRTSVCWTGGW